MSPKTPPQRRLADVESAAAYIDVGIRTIRRWSAEGRLPAYRVGPKLVRYDLNDLDNLVRRIPTGGDAA